MFFGYGVIAFALVKIFSNFFFARDNTKTPFYISSFIVLLNIIYKCKFFDRNGFLIIPIATSILNLGWCFYFFIFDEKKKLFAFTKEIILTIFTRS